MEDDVDNQYTGQVLKLLYQQSKNKHLTDFVIRAGNTRVSCHRAVISAKSEFFDSLCLSGQQEVSLDYADEEHGHILEAIVRFMYLGCIDITSYNVESLLHASHLIKHRDLTRSCENYMVANLGLENFESYQSLANKFSLFHLSDVCVTFTKRKGSDVLKTDWILSLSVNELHEYLKSDDLNVVSEDEVLEALQRWLRCTKASSTLKDGYTDRLFPAVRLHFCDKNFLRVLSKDAFDRLKLKILEYLQHGRHGDHSARSSYSTTVKSHVEPTYTEPKPSEPTYTEPTPPSPPSFSRAPPIPPKLRPHSVASALPASQVQTDRVLFVGGFKENDEVNRNITFLDSATDAALTSSPFSAYNGSYSACTTGDGLIISGGYDRSAKRSMSKVKIFSLSNKSWSDLPDLAQPKNHHGTVCARRRYYTVGGEHRENDVIQCRYASVDATDLKTLRRSMFLSLPVAVSAPGVAHVCNSILVFGGDPGTGADCSSNTYSYDITTGLRKTCQRMPRSGRVFRTTAVVHDSVFVLFFEDFLQYDVEHDTWVQLASPPKPSNFPAMVLHENRLLVLGGKRDRPKDRIQTFDLATKTWGIETRTMPVALRSHWALVVKMPTSK